MPRGAQLYPMRHGSGLTSTFTGTDAPCLSKASERIVLACQTLRRLACADRIFSSLVVAAALGDPGAAGTSHATTQALVAFLSESGGDSAFSIVDRLLPLAYHCISLCDGADQACMSSERVAEQNTQFPPLERVN